MDIQTGTIDELIRKQILCLETGTFANAKLSLNILSTNFGNVVLSCDLKDPSYGILYNANMRELYPQSRSGTIYRVEVNSPLVSTSTLYGWLVQNGPNGLKIRKELLKR